MVLQYLGNVEFVAVRNANAANRNFAYSSPAADPESGSGSSYSPGADSDPQTLADQLNCKCSDWLFVAIITIIKTSWFLTVILNIIAIRILKMAIFTGYCWVAYCKLLHSSSSRQHIIVVVVVVIVVVVVVVVIVIIIEIITGCSPAELHIISPPSARHMQTPEAKLEWVLSWKRKLIKVARTRCNNTFQICQRIQRKLARGYTTFISQIMGI